MATTDAQGLISRGSCYNCTGGGLSVYQMMKLALLAQLSLLVNASNDVTPQGLINQGACFSCLGMLSMYEIMEMVLLKQIAGG
jgi:hypothetical protein